MIRIAQETDAEALLALYAPYVEKTAITFEYDVPTPEVFRGRIRHTLDRYPYLVAEEDGAILGFGNIGPDAYLDLLYVHKDHQRQGISSVLCDFLETLYPVDRITVHASETAWPFFEKQGYRMLRSQRVERRGQVLTNYVMEKELS